MAPNKTTTSPQVALARLETTLRMTAVGFIAYTFAYADLPRIIPSSQKYLLGMFGSIVVMRIPTYVFTPGIMVPIFLVISFFALASITAVLAAASVGDGLFLATIALWSFWVSSFQYGPLSKITYVFPAFLLTAFGLFGMGMVDYVQNGIEFQVDQEVLGTLLAPISGGEASLNATNGIDSLLPSSLIPYLPLIMKSVTELQAGVKEGAFDQVTSIAETGFLAGRNLQFKLTDQGDLSIVIEGGIWIVKLMWTQSGLDNPLAMMKNFIIILLWLIVIALVGPLLPPWRTSRKDNTQLLIPDVLKDASNFLEAVGGPEHDSTDVDNVAEVNHVSTSKPKDAEKEVDSALITRSMNQDFGLSKRIFIQESPPSHIQALREKIWEYSNIINGGTTSGLFSAFEPRLLACRLGKPISCSWLALTDLLETVESVVLATLAFESIPTTSLESKQKTMEILNQCASAMEISDKAFIDDDDNDENSQNDLKKTDRTLSSYFDQIIEETHTTLRIKTNKWIDLMENNNNDNVIITPEESRKNLIKNILVWFVPPLSIFVRLVEFPLSPLLILRGKRRLDVGKLIHCVKFSIGFTALVCMTHYWDRFRNMEVTDTELNEESSGVKFTDSAHESFSGWVLISYSFATMATTEGTVKKSLFRLIGTLIGGFSAWLGLLLASDSEIGMIAWLTITSFVAIFFSVDNESVIKARMGQSSNYGYGGFYVVLTQSVITMQFLGGNGNRNDLVADRIISNLTGILMATVLAVIPPAIYGGDPSRAHFIADEIQNGLIQCIKLAIDKDVQGLRKFQESHLKTTRALRGDILFLIDDAKRFESFAFFRVNPALEHEMGSMAYTSLSLSYLAHFSADNLEEDPDHYNADELRKILQEVENKVDLIHDETKDYTTTPDDTTYYKAIKMIEKRSDAHKTNLGNISWGAKW